MVKMMRPALILLAMSICGCAESSEFDPVALVETGGWVSSNDCIETPTCGVGMTEGLFSISDADGTGTSEPAGYPAMDSRQRMFTASANTSGVVLVWDSLGNLVQRFGRHGDGPAEMVGLVDVHIGIGDSIHARDNQDFWSVFDPDLRYVRRVQGRYAPVGFNLLLPSGNVVSGFGYSHQILVHDRNGRRIAEMGLETTPDLTSPPELKVFATATPGEFWSVRWRRPDFQRWSTKDGLIRSFGEPKGTRFPPQGEVVEASHDEYVREPAIMDARVINGLIWYKALLPTTPGAVEELTSTALDNQSDHLVEVIDPATWTVVASSLSDRSDQSFNGFVNDTLAWRWTTDRFGVPEYEFVRFGLIQAVPHG